MMMMMMKKLYTSQNLGEIEIIHILDKHILLIHEVTRSVKIELLSRILKHFRQQLNIDMLLSVSN